MKQWFKNCFGKRRQLVPSQDDLGSLLSAACEKNGMQYEIQTDGKTVGVWPIGMQKTFGGKLYEFDTLAESVQACLEDLKK